MARRGRPRMPRQTLEMLIDFIRDNLERRPDGLLVANDFIVTFRQGWAVPRCLHADKVLEVLTLCFPLTYGADGRRYLLGAAWKSDPRETAHNETRIQNGMVSTTA